MLCVCLFFIPLFACFQANFILSHRFDNQAFLRCCAVSQVAKLYRYDG